MDGKLEGTQNVTELNSEDFDPFLLMEDLVEKLKVLDYEALFTRTK
jgi:hypothetical protein